jgi:hypothetical protein
MWHKKDAIGIWIWIPNGFKFKQSLAFFTIENNLLNENKQIRYDKINPLKDIATIIVYENNANNALIDLFTEHVISSLPIIGIFSFIRNRYSKPFTGAFELLEQIASKANQPKPSEPKSDEPKSNEPKSNEPKSNEPKSNEPKSNEPKSNEVKSDELKSDEVKSDEPFKFKPEWSILVSFDIGINGRYIDRAFAYNIGIKTVTTPDLYFKHIKKKIEWYWPSYVLLERRKKKLFLFDGEPKFADFLFPNHINIVVITGPPNSGKTILARRISSYIGSSTICKDELPETTGKSLIHIGHAPSRSDKENLIKWLLKLNKPYKSTDKLVMPNLIWIEMNLPRALVEFIRYLRVQMNYRTCPVLSSDSNIKNYYKSVESLSDDKIPSVITHIQFPLILKKIPELDYIY